VQIVDRLTDKDPILSFSVRLCQNKEKVDFLEPVCSDQELVFFDGIEWLSSLPLLLGREVIFVENNLEKIKGVLDDPLFLAFLEHDKAHIITTVRFPVFVGGKTFEVFTNNSSPLFRDFVEQVIRFEALFREGMDLGISHFRNVLLSLKSFSSFYEISSLKGNFKAPWLVVGGAPLTDEEVLFIQKSHKTHWLIGAGAGTKNLLEKGIRPDFATLVDPFPQPEKYVEHAIPTFFQLRAQTEYLKMCKGGLIWAGQNDLYPLECDLAQKAGLSDILFDGGYDTANFCAVLAQKMGATRIEFKGVSKGRNTLNDLYSRLYLKRLELKKQTGKKGKETIDKQFSMTKTELNHKRLFSYLNDILEAKDPVDLIRLGVEEGYLRPLRIYLGKESISLEPLLELLKKALEGITA